MSKIRRRQKKTNTGLIVVVDPDGNDVCHVKGKKENDQLGLILSSTWSTSTSDGSILIVGDQTDAFIIHLD